MRRGMMPSGRSMIPTNVGFDYTATANFTEITARILVFEEWDGGYRYVPGLYPDGPIVDISHVKVSMDRGGTEFALFSLIGNNPNSNVVREISENVHQPFSGQKASVIALPHSIKAHPGDRIGLWINRTGPDADNAAYSNIVSTPVSSLRVRYSNSKISKPSPGTSLILSNYYSSHYMACYAYGSYTPA